MENKWEYDYSGLYHNGYTPAPGPYPVSYTHLTLPTNREV